MIFCISLEHCSIMVLFSTCTRLQDIQKYFFYYAFLNLAFLINCMHSRLMHAGIFSLVSDATGFLHKRFGVISGQSHFAHEAPFSSSTSLSPINSDSVLFGSKTDSSCVHWLSQRWVLWWQRGAEDVLDMVLSMSTRLTWRLQSLIILSQFVKQGEQGKVERGVRRWGWLQRSQRKIQMRFNKKQKRWGRERISSPRLYCLAKVRLRPECQRALSNCLCQRQAVWPSHDNEFLNSSLNLHLY